VAAYHEELKAVRQRKYVARDFDGLRAQIFEYARLYYSDKVKDLSENSIGGLLLDMAAYVGDNLSFYLDHQYGELNADTAVENVNIERALNSSGVPIVGASPAIAPITAYIQVPAETVNNVIVPRESAIPIIRSRSIFSADNGTEFVLLEDIDFTKKSSNGTYVAEIKIGQKNNDGSPTSFVMAATGLAISGKELTETVTIGNKFVPFRELTLANANVSEIISVSDGFGNIYYKVEALTHDVVYKNVLNVAGDSDLVKDALKVVPAPYRFMTKTDLGTRKTSLIFGGGSATTLEDDVIPDPSDFAIAFPYSRTFSRISVNPQQLLQTKTLGVASTSTTLSITYRYGGGLDHNVIKNGIRNIKTLNMTFPNSPTAAQAAVVRGSVEVTNRIRATGGEDAPSNDDLKALIPAIKNSQDRIVSREDLLARVYTLPSNFGRVFRAAIRSNPSNPLATQLLIISRDQNSKLIVSPDTLKLNLKRYLNPYRMISDAIDVIDAQVINLKLSFDILIDPSLNRSIVIQNALTKLQSTLNIKNFHIDQPIVMSTIENVIFSTPGVISVNDVKFETITGNLGSRTYSDSTFDVTSNTVKGLLLPPPGGIFEVKYPEFDIIGKTSV